MTGEDWYVTLEFKHHDEPIQGPMDIRGCRSFVKYVQEFYDRPLRIKLRDDINRLEIDWKTIDVCCGCSIPPHKSE